HTVLLADDGNAWYTGNKNATIGKLDPATGEGTEDPTPDPAAEAPHTATFAPAGIPCFTTRRSDTRGRRAPATRGAKGPTRRAPARARPRPGPARGPTAARAPPGAPPGRRATAPTARSGSTPRPWRCPRSSCRRRGPRCAGSPSPRTARSGTSTPHKGASAITT